MIFSFYNYVGKNRPNVRVFLQVINEGGELLLVVRADGLGKLRNKLAWGGWAEFP